MAFKPVRNFEKKADRKAIFTFLNTPLNTDSVVFADFPNTAIYSPVSYIPSVFSIFILKKLHFSIGSIFYGARFFSFLIWIVAIFYSIRIIPVHKKLFMCLALLPMSLSVNSSLSADTVTNMGAFILIAYTLRCAFSDKKYSIINFMVMSLLVLLLASAKLLYTPLVLLFLMIPKEKFTSKRAFYLQFGSLLSMGLLVVFLWASAIKHLHIPYSSYNPAYRDNGIDVYKGADAFRQMHFVESHWLYFIKVTLNSFLGRESFLRNCEAYIGILGWFDLALFPWMYILAYMLLFFTVITENGYGNRPFTIKHRIIMLISLLVVLFLINLSQYMSFATIEDKYVVMQGRYFIPVLPLLFILFTGKGLKKHWIINPVIIICIVSILSTTLSILHSRYY
jgi:uncharacterized membrane protein